MRRRIPFYEHSHTARQLGVSLTVAKARVFHAKTPSANQESCVTSTGAAVVHKLAGLRKPQLGKRGLIASRQSLPIWSYAG
jgi:hypothetical protein